MNRFTVEISYKNIGYLKPRLKADVERVIGRLNWYLARAIIVMY